MDLRHDRRLLHCYVFRPSICDSNCDGNPDCFVQRSHCHRKCSKQGQKSTIHEITELVLLGDDNVLSLWRECDILLQAYRAGGQGIAAFRDPPSLHQFHAICHWYVSPTGQSPLMLNGKPATHFLCRVCVLCRLS